MRAYSGSGGIAPGILNLGIRWMWVVSFTPKPLYSQWEIRIWNKICTLYTHPYSILILWQ